MVYEVFCRTTKTVICNGTREFCFHVLDNLRCTDVFNRYCVREVSYV